MSEELNNQLAGLASKLGVTVEHLWGVLVRQAYILPTLPERVQS